MKYRQLSDYLLWAFLLALGALPIRRSGKEAV